MTASTQAGGGGRRAPGRQVKASTGLTYTLLVLGYALACSLLVNDLAKYTLIGRLGVARPARRGRP